VVQVPQSLAQNGLTPKLFLPELTPWTHHRAGWACATGALARLHSPTGTRLYDWYDAVLRDGRRLTQPWAGFIHNMIDYPDEYGHKYRRLYALGNLRSCPTWEPNLACCRGLFTLCEHTARHLRTLTSVPVSAVPHPIPDDFPHFSTERFYNNPTPRVVHAGQWGRKFHALCDLKTRWKKTMLHTGPVWEADFAAVRKYRPDCDIEVMEYVPHEQYDDLLANNIAFLWLYDAAACNTVLECLIRGTPILVNRLPALEEYLGEDYPFFYETLDGANAKVEDRGLIEAAHAHLETATIRPRLTADAFVAAVTESDVYRRLPEGKVF
jgi:hypothetical protein